jgi:murein DD-endopeptidase MepM/ murein hydrolase activator NlpD
VTQGDIFGWNVYLHTAAGVIYFSTHNGDYLVRLGQRVKAGQLIAHVGHWPGDPGRSHTHLGVTHPAGVTAAKNYICKVANAPMLP